MGIGMVGNCLLEALRYIKLTNFTKLVCVNGDDIESCEAVFWVVAFHLLFLPVFFIVQSSEIPGVDPGALIIRQIITCCHGAS